MPSIFRVHNLKHVASSGTGAAQFGGRWNPKNVQAVYAGASRALCILERIVHLASSLPQNEAVTEITVPDSLPMADLHPLPKRWNEPEIQAEVQRVASEFVVARDLAVLRVPSIIVPEERCYILWPAHPDFSRIVFHPPQKFTYDIRLRPDLL
jgi:RES domain-containing protein